MSMAEAVIEARGLHTRIGGQSIHRGLDLSVQRGEILALVGASGSGKTTLLRQLLLLSRPDAGEIRLFGRSVDALSADEERRLRTRLGVMFQQGALFTSLTVRENVSVPLWEHTRLRPAFVRELAALKIRFAGLPASAADKYPGELSGGMIKRAAVARALALDPELLFLDEPTAGLDPLGGAAFDELVFELRAALGLTVVIVTHDLDTVWQADRVAFLGEGRLLACGPAAELAQSEHAEVRRYFTSRRRQREDQWTLA